VDAFASDLSADLETILFRQDDVEDDRVVVVDGREEEGFRTVRGVVDGVRRLAKPPSKWIRAAVGRTSASRSARASAVAT
jgi:hypothetical protein